MSAGFAEDDWIAMDINFTVSQLFFELVVIVEIMNEISLSEMSVMWQGMINIVRKS